MSEPSRDMHLRLPETLAKAIEAQAKANERSFNGEVIVRLKASVKK